MPSIEKNTIAPNGKNAVKQEKMQVKTAQNSKQNRSAFQLFASVIHLVDALLGRGTIMGTGGPKWGVPERSSR